MQAYCSEMGGDNDRRELKDGRVCCYCCFVVILNYERQRQSVIVGVVSAEGYWEDWVPVTRSVILWVLLARKATGRTGCLSRQSNFVGGVSAEGYWEDWVPVTRGCMGVGT